MHQADTEDWIWFVRFDVRNTAKRQMIGLFDKFGNHPYVHVLVNNGILSSIPNCMISVQMYVIFIFFTFEALRTLLITRSSLYQRCFQYFDYPIYLCYQRSQNLYNWSTFLFMLSFDQFYYHQCSRCFGYFVLSTFYHLYLPFAVFFTFCRLCVPFAINIYLLPFYSTFCRLYLPFAVFVYLLPSISTFCRFILPFAVFIYLFPSLSTFCH